MNKVNLFVQMVTLMLSFSINCGMLHGNTIDSLNNNNIKKYKDSVEFPNGDYYRIYSIDGTKYEECRFTYPDGDTYEGFCKNGKRNGKDMITYTNGDIYDGDWAEGEATGTAKITYANGDKYEGSLTNRVWNGHGKLTLNNGRSFEGKFVNGILNEKDIFLAQEGAYIENRNSEEELSDDESYDEDEY